MMDLFGAIPEFSERHWIAIGAAFAAILIAEAIYLVYADAKSHRDRINRRMKGMSAQVSQQDVMVKLRRERGMTASGAFILPIAWLNTLIIQSGITMGIPRLFAIVGLFALACGGAAAVQMQSIGAGLGVGFVAGTLVPILVLKMKRGRMLKRFGTQLPEAIELIVRSLKAGHPVPVALSMVGRELPDPIGSEFGLIADEITYGSDLVSALKSMQARVGHPDLPLLVIAVSIQSSSGGNLREILDNLAQMIRMRIKMRRKVVAISSEGRISAVVLSALPLVMLGVVAFASPDYYGAVWGDTETYIGLGAGFLWMAIGNVMLLKMVSFEI
ncbi:MAG: type II secretion system F family protein [Pseudomonadota bacterium]